MKRSKDGSGWGSISNHSEAAHRREYVLHVSLLGATYKAYASTSRNPRLTRRTKSGTVGGRDMVAMVITCSCLLHPNPPGHEMSQMLEGA